MHRLLLVFLLIPFISFSQKLPGVEQKTAGLKKYEGFLDFYWNDTTGKILMDIHMLDSQILYVSSLPAGLGSNDIGLDRGLLSETRIVEFTRVGRKILMVQPNYAFRALSGDKAEQKAAEESFAKSTIWAFTVEAESNGHSLVDATEFLTRDAANVINRIRNMKQGNYTLDKNRSAIYLPNSKNFPLNTELEASVTFVSTDGLAGEFVRSVAPSADALTLRIHHSFVQLPDNNYTPRTFDPRSSFIPMSYFDFSTPVSEPITKYLILRHRLQKKDPGAAKSEPVKPIIYYLDNGTPEPIRSALLDGARWWNQAFEAAGFINAFQVQVLPDTADPMDIRYNMINWVHRSTRGWSYGYSVSDPRTGEIIKGNVTLGSLRVRQDYLIAQGLLAPFENGVPADDKMLKMALDRLRQLAAHEVGHTLGLMHNYAASISDRASVMDYPHPTISLDAKGNIDLSKAYSKGIGEWDKIAITWGYSEFRSGTNEKDQLDQLLDTASKKGYQFIADRDARAVGGMHPYAHLWDNGTNATDELNLVLKIRQKALDNFGEKNIREGTSMAMLEDVLVPVYLYHRYQAEAVAKLIGGLNYTYALRGDGQLITEPVSKTEQQKALTALINCIDPNVLLLPDRILKMIPPRPSGYAYTKELFQKRTGLVLDALAPAETAADLPLSFLFNSERLNRLASNAVQNNLGLVEAVGILLSKTWKAGRRSGLEGLVQMQTEQVVLTYLLASSIDDNNSFITKAIISKALNDLKVYIENQKKLSKDATYTGHLILALERMKAPDKAKPTIHADIPPGAPIGCFQD